ncbi:MAG: hypothetical protein ACK4NS_05240 [Saprospiraceae bacterium]
MAFELVSMTPEELLEFFQETVESLLYMSETDAELEVFILGVAEVGEAFSPEDLTRLFYSGDDQPKAQSISWAEANRLESNGTKDFFGNRCNVITTAPDNTYTIHEEYHRENVPMWRDLRDLYFDNLVQNKYFRVSLAEPDTARHDLYLVGRHIEVMEDFDTNEMQTRLLDWFVIKTYVIET